MSWQGKERGSVCVVCTCALAKEGWAGGRALDCVRTEPQVQGTVMQGVVLLGDNRIGGDVIVG